MTKKQYQRYSAEFKLRALKRASEDGVRFFLSRAGYEVPKQPVRPRRPAAGYSASTFASPGNRSTGKCLNFIQVLLVSSVRGRSLCFEEYEG